MAGFAQSEQPRPNQSGGFVRCRHPGFGQLLSNRAAGPAEPSPSKTRHLANMFAGFVGSGSMCSPLSTRNRTSRSILTLATIVSGLLAGCGGGFAPFDRPPEQWEPPGAGQDAVDEAATTSLRITPSARVLNGEVCS